jgi:hypothetical protein
MDHNTNLIGISKKFDEKINALQTKFFSALDDFKKYYVYYNKNPEVNEYQNYYENSKTQLQNMSKDVFLISNDIDNNIDSLNDQMIDISVELEEEKQNYNKMMSQLKNLKTTQDGSEILIDDAKIAYNIQYYRNWEMFIGIIIASGLVIKLFRPPVISQK